METLHTSNLRRIVIEALETSLVEWKLANVLSVEICQSALGNFLSGMETTFAPAPQMRADAALETSLVEWKPSAIAPLTFPRLTPWKLP